MPIIREMNSKLPPVIILLITLPSMWVRGTPAATKQVPVVSRINTEVNGNEIVITWKDAAVSKPDVYRVLRSPVPVNFSDSGRPGEPLHLAFVKSGIETFTDSPPAGREWWYAVVPVQTADEGSAGMPLIRWRNVTGRPVSVNKAVPGNRKPAEERRLTARTAGDNLTVIRSPGEITDPAALDRAVTINTQAVSSASGDIIDPPPPEMPWYHDAADRKLFDSNDPRLLSGAVFSPPVTVSPIKESREPATIRPFPLPRLRISQGFTDGEPITAIDGELPYRHALSEEAARVTAELIGAGAAAEEQPEALILEVDRGFSNHRRQRKLREILDDSFADEDWERTESELFSLSASNDIESELRSRIHFYRGQAFYFLNQPYRAFIAFLTAADHYYFESRTWMLRIYSDIIPVSSISRFSR